MNKIKLIISIQSISDIITNSSSELFVLNHNSIDYVKSIISEFVDNYESSCSGMGGEIEITTVKEDFDKNFHSSCGVWIDNIKHTPDTTWYSKEELFELYIKQMFTGDEISDDFVTENTIIVDIDWAYQNTINMIILKLGAKYCLQ